MFKTVISNELKLNKLRHIKSFAHEMVCLEIEKKFLSGQLPTIYKEAKMRYRTTPNVNFYKKH